MELTSILQIITTSAILAGGIFAGVQLRIINKQRKRDSAIQLVHSFQTPEFLEAVDLVFNLPEGLTKKEVEERLAGKMGPVLMMFGTFESLGILIYRGELEIDLVEDFFSGIIIFSWKKLKNYIVGMREMSGRHTYYEWVQWLAEQFEKRESKTPAVPSYIAHKDWNG